MYWCDICKVWLQDTKQAKLNHERGSRHQELLSKKLRDMGKKADEQKRIEKEAAKSIGNIEAAARKQYEEDLKAMESSCGKWVYQASTGYYYNEVYRWYYDLKTGWYYGGDPPDWAQDPQLPSAATFHNAPKEGGPAAGGSKKAGDHGKKDIPEVLVKRQVAIPAHPLANVGGYQMPTVGRLGAAKGVGGGSNATAKRKRPVVASKTKEVDKEEQEELARREAARQRVQQRTASTFGLL